jgi:hypothetical protein
MSIQLGNGRLKSFLNTGITGLPLPAAEGAALVLQTEGDAAKTHGRIRWIGGGSQLVTHEKAAMDSRSTAAEKCGPSAV